MTRPPRTTRLAPSPTGALHLGNARTFLANWLLARQAGWRIVLRIEDIDGPRIKSGAADQALDDLRWLGLDWDEGPVFQTSRLRLYRQAIDRLLRDKLVYPCICSRREVELAASAPHAEDGSAVYPGTCRGRFATLEDAARLSGRPPALRFAVGPGPVAVHDEFRGTWSCDPARELGDFVIAKGDGTPAYQLAVVVDDADMGITDVLRGDDLLDSAPRQMLLYRALGLGQRIPRYYHLPLVVGPDGRRLAKRHGDTRLAHYRGRGVSAGRIVALLARWLGMEAGEEAAPADLIQRFDLSAVPRSVVVMDASAERFLLGR